MCIRPQWRTLLSAVAIGVLILALFSAQGYACGIGQPSHSRDCCTSDGNCKADSDNDGSSCCLRARTADFVALEQSSHERAATADAVRTPVPILVAIAAAPSPSATLARYSPPDIYLLNSAFLI